MMKKALLALLALITLSCGSDDGPAPVDAIVGKWIVYKIEYENTTYEYEINGECGKESLEMLAGSNFVKETFYTNEDCSTYTSSTGWEWRKESDGVYNIYEMGQIVPERNVILTGNEMKVTEPGFITVKKYYRTVR